MGNWLILVLLGLLWLVGHTKSHTMGSFDNQVPSKDTNRAIWFGMTQFGGQTLSDEVILVEKMEDLTKNAHFEAILDF